MATTPFLMHPKLLKDVIERQAGSLWKAVLEGTMNSIEAGATRVDITVDPLHLRIADDGQGFQSKEQLETCFRTFGAPHHESEGKVWAEFRMGRGQLFAHGINVWRSGPFRMSVAIHQNLGYDLEEGLAPVRGCTIDIDLHTGLSDGGVHQLTRDIKHAVRYVQVPVQVNGVTINTPPDGQTWDAITTNTAYIRLRATGNEHGSGIDIYNLGVFVQTIPAWKYGLSGVIVSRERLQVNFARNDIMSSCPVWRLIRPILERQATVKRTKAARMKINLTDDERIEATQRLIDGDLDHDSAHRLRLLLDIHGVGLSSLQLQRSSLTRWTHANRDDPRADRLAQEGLVLVLDRAGLDLFGDRPDEVLHRAWATSDGHTMSFAPRRMSYVPFDAAASHLHADAVIISDTAWTSRERAWMGILTWATRTARWTAHQRNPGIMSLGGERSLRVGVSDSADGWTDGSTFIAISRTTMPLHAPIAAGGRINVRALGDFLVLIAHEYAHDEASFGNGHGRDFYKRFHDLMTAGFVHDTIAKATRRYTPERLAGVLRHHGCEASDLVGDDASEADTTTDAPRLACAS